MTDYAMTSYLQKKIGDHIFQGTVFTPPSATYLSLHTANPTDSGSRSNEISTSGTGYARQSLVGKMSTTDPTSGLISLTGVINFDPALIDLGTVTHVGIDDDVSAGNMLFFAAVSTVQIMSTGTQFQLVAGQLAITFQ